MTSGITFARFESLKRQATRLQRARPDLSRSEALDQVARSEGFRNWSLLAQARFPGNEKIQRVLTPKPHEVIVRCIVRSHEPGVRPIWWDEKVPANHSKQYYQKFKWVPEHFEIIGRNEASVRERLAVIRRAIEFMDSTELKPSKAWTRLLPRSYRSRNPEGLDHTAVWRDEKKRYVITTEPYIGRDAVGEIEGWCEAHGWRVAVAPKGCGIWNPCHIDCPTGCTGHTQLIVLSPEKNGVDPKDVVAALS